MKNKHAQALGKRGNAKLREKLGDDAYNAHMKELSKKGVEARKAKMIQFDTVEAKTDA
jgi:hypothetical protein